MKSDVSASDVTAAIAALREFVANPAVRTGAQWTEREGRLRRAIERDKRDMVRAAIEVWDQTTGRDLLAALNRNVNRKAIYQTARTEFAEAIAKIARDHG